MPKNYAGTNYQRLVAWSHLMAVLLLSEYVIRQLSKTTLIRSVNQQKKHMILKFFMEKKNVLFRKP